MLRQVYVEALRRSKTRPRGSKIRSWDVLGVLLVALEVRRGPKTLQEAPKSRFLVDFGRFWIPKLKIFSLKIDVGREQGDFLKITLPPTQEHDFQGSRCLKILPNLLKIRFDKRLNF